MASQYLQVRARCVIGMFAFKIESKLHCVRAYDRPLFSKTSTVRLGSTVAIVFQNNNDSSRRDKCLPHDLPASDAARKLHMCVVMIIYSNVGTRFESDHIYIYLTFCHVERICAINKFLLSETHLELICEVNSSVLVTAPLRFSGTCVLSPCS